MKIIITILSFVFLSCNGKSSNASVDGDETGGSSSIFGYSDGTYCAEIDYYNSETGTSSTYTLEVEIEDNELAIIHWPNGGWLDSSHFTPPDISDGEASFTSDTGADYSVQIIGEEGECNTDSYAESQDDIDQAKQDRENQEEERIREEEEEEEEEDLQRQRDQEEEEQDRRRQEEEENN